MTDEDQVALLRRSVAEWNAWREANPSIVPDLRELDLQGADLIRADLRGANLQGTDLQGAYLFGANLHKAKLHEAKLPMVNLQEADLHGADLGGANLQGADLRMAKLQEADLHGADLGGANLQGADLHRANLQGTDLHRANLRGAIFQGSNLQGTKIHGALLGATVLADVDLSQIQGLDMVSHNVPSMIGIDTLIASKGQIPEGFLRGCGVPDSWIEYLPSLIGSLQPIQYYSCFISYSTNDEAFAQRLHGRLQQNHVRVWYAPHDLKIDKLYGQIDEAIRVYDKLLLILSEESMRSNWVETELRLALKKERSAGCRVLFPVRLTSYEALEHWSCFDGDSKRDLATDVRSYYIGDFSAWKDHDTFETSFARLLSDLRSPESVRPKR